MKRSVVLSSVLSSALLLAACGDETPNNNEAVNENNAQTEDAVDEDKGEIEIGFNNWAENIAITNMWKILLEEQGYDVDITMSEKAPIWEAIGNGDIDLSLEVWLPTTDEPFYDDYEDSIELNDVWFEGTGLGLAVPEYMDIDSIEDLNDIADELENDIYGIDPGASLSRLTEEAIEEYDLDYELLVSSEPAMISQLDSAYGQEEQVLVTLWNPHWVFSDYDVKYLEDPKGVYGEPEDIYTISRLGFEEDHPEIIEWLNNWEMDDETLGELMSVINELEDEEEGARQWIEDNRDLINEWITD